ncbi:Methionine aminopeptidase 1 [Sparassis crispa]|uniref:Methionine aminopeptidase n=1 Tax=Sparassis crispa TaxID=139825 RepID=A0A401GDK1_9APHY|nr:Methionine aminopeptidase 1 [Sparassis crispa]GBE80240.1 Methionine aminopeptidase 1 [Sparassis crispa]
MRARAFSILRGSSRHRPHAISLTLRRTSHRSVDLSETTSDVANDFGSYDVILPPEPFVWGVAHIKPRCVPEDIRRPRYALSFDSASTLGFGEDTSTGPQHVRDKLIALQDEETVRRVGRLAKEVLLYAGSLVQVGVTTEAVDAAVHEFILSHSAYPSPLLYNGFPKSCCTSVNNIITHGIPDDRSLMDGDIVNVDITIYKDGFHGDTSQTFLVGDVDEQGRALVQTTREALEASIAACAPGRPFKGIGKAIYELVRNTEFSVNTQFTGHGIGEDFHRRPWILHHLNDEPGVMLPGHCFTIEPCIVQGADPNGWMFPDGWTVSTENCARSAQAEHMVLITETGAEVLTR